MHTQRHTCTLPFSLWLTPCPIPLAVALPCTSTGTPSLSLLSFPLPITNPTLFGFPQRHCRTQSSRTHKGPSPRLLTHPITSQPTRTPNHTLTHSSSQTPAPCPGSHPSAPAHPGTPIAHPHLFPGTLAPSSVHTCGPAARPCSLTPAGSREPPSHRDHCAPPVLLPSQTPHPHRASPPPCPCCAHPHVLSMPTTVQLLCPHYGPPCPSPCSPPHTHKSSLSLAQPDKAHPRPGHTTG